MLKNYFLENLQKNIFVQIQIVLLLVLKQLEFASMNSYPDAFHVDAFTLLWSNLSPYISPPFKLIVRKENDTPFK